MLALEGELDRFEKETIEFFTRVRNSYLDNAARQPDRYAVIDAEMPLEEVQSATLEAVQERFEEVRTK